MQIEQLTPNSPKTAIRSAISDTIEQCMQEGGSQKDCAAKAYGQAREKTGQALEEGTIR